LETTPSFVRRGFQERCGKEEKKHHDKIFINKQAASHAKQLTQLSSDSKNEHSKNIITLVLFIERFGFTVKSFCALHPNRGFPTRAAIDFGERFSIINLYCFFLIFMWQ